MLKRDFIMVQIEELGKVIAQIIGLKNTAGARQIPEMIKTVYTSLNIDSEFLIHSHPEEIHSVLNREDNEGLRRMEIAAKILLEESGLYPDRKQTILLKTRELLEYIQKHDKTFSLERVALLDDIRSMLSDTAQ